MTLAGLLRYQLSNDEWRRVQSTAIAWAVAGGVAYGDAGEAVTLWLVDLVRRSV